MNDQANSFVVAFATSDGVSIPKTHFGEAAQYEIYRISSDGARKLESVVNPHAADGHDASSHHHHHLSDGSGRGAGIGRLLGQYGVQVMVSRAFGPNIKRMRQRFVPVKIDADRLTTAVALLQIHWDRVQSCWLKGEGRKHLVLRSTS